MIGLFSGFAESGPSIHVAPAPVLNIGGLEITNSILYGWLVCLFMIIFFIYIARKITIHPKGGIIQYVEAGVEFAINLVQDSFDDKKVGRKYVPFFASLFVFILVSNWAGLIPWVGEGIRVGDYPVFRPMTGDLNATLAMGLITMAVVYTASIKEAGGIYRYIRHFFMGSPLNPLYLVIGLIEMITDLTRALSLSLRLFLNIAIGEIVIAVFGYLGSMLAPGQILTPIAALPFTLLELGVGALQAYIFVILGVNYLAISVNSTHGHDDLTEDEQPETINKVVAKAEV